MMHTLKGWVVISLSPWAQSMKSFLFLPIFLIIQCPFFAVASDIKMILYEIIEASASKQSAQLGAVQSCEPHCDEANFDMSTLNAAYFDSPTLEASSTDQFDRPKLDEVQSYAPQNDSSHFDTPTSGKDQFDELSIIHTADVDNLKFAADEVQYYSPKNDTEVDFDTPTLGTDQFDFDAPTLDSAQLEASKVVMDKSDKIIPRNSSKSQNLILSTFTSFLVLLISVLLALLAQFSENAKPKTC